MVQTQLESGNADSRILSLENLLPRGVTLLCMRLEEPQIVKVGIPLRKLKSNQYEDLGIKNPTTHDYMYYRLLCVIGSDRWNMVEVGKVGRVDA